MGFSFVNHGKEHVEDHARGLPASGPYDLHHPRDTNIRVTRLNPRPHVSCGLQHATKGEPMGLFGGRRSLGDSGDSAGGLIRTESPLGRSSFRDVQTIGDYAVLSWDTGLGVVGIAYPLFAGNGSPVWLVEEIWRTHGDGAHLSFASIVVVQTLWLTGPELHAVDLTGGGRYSRLYKPSWRQLAEVVGMEVPWWHSTLRDRRTILDWKPGDPPAVVPAEHPDLRIAPLTLLATDEPDGSPAGEVCLRLARHLRHEATDAALRYVNHVEQAQDRACRGLAVAAVPAPVPRVAPGELPDVVRRAGWAQIVERNDTLAYAVADLAGSWDSGRGWPIGCVAELDPARCELAAEFVDRLEPVQTGGRALTVLERWILTGHIGSAEIGTLLSDPASGLPAVHIAQTHDRSQDRIVAASPQRIPTTSPLTAVTFSNHNVWVHTADSGLWLAPQIDGHGLSWGYNGGGPWTLALLLRDLLDDITAPAVDDTGGPPPDGLLELATNAPQDEATTLTRTHLEAARNGR